MLSLLFESLPITAALAHPPAHRSTTPTPMPSWKWVRSAHWTPSFLTSSSMSPEMRHFYRTRPGGSAILKKKIPSTHFLLSFFLLPILFLDLFLCPSARMSFPNVPLPLQGHRLFNFLSHLISSHHIISSLSLYGCLSVCLPPLRRGKYVMTRQCSESSC